MSPLMIRGTIAVAGGEFPVAGVTVIATTAPDVTDTNEKSVDSAYQRPPAHKQQLLGQAITTNDGTFEIETDQSDATVARWTCAMQSCAAFQFRISCTDIDGTTLHVTDSLSYSNDAPVSIELPDSSVEPAAALWQELSERLLQSQTARIALIVDELTSLSPNGIFRDWQVRQRLGVLDAIQQALLDPDNALGDFGMPVRFDQLSNPAATAALRERLTGAQRPDLMVKLEESIDRANLFGSLRDISAYADPALLGQGAVSGGINRYLQPDDRVSIDTIPWVVSPLVGYRDYLRDRWVDHQRMVNATPSERSTRAQMFARLANRLHQNFTVVSTVDKPALSLLAAIVRTIAEAPANAGYGFGIPAATIEAQGERSNREYLDYLISLTKHSQAELEKRYRLNLRRSELDVTNPVQLNIDTLQRFFTDSYQSALDPFAISPDRLPGTTEPLISVFPVEGAGPFFLEYEEWLEREAAFYPENHYDPRATYHWTLYDRFQNTHEVVWTHSMPVANFLMLSPDGRRPFVPGSPGYNLVAAKWQWVRNHIELFELSEAAFADVQNLNYSAAEEKYRTALEWVTKLRDFVGPDSAWSYNPNAFAKTQKNYDVSDIDKLTQFEHSGLFGLGQYFSNLTFDTDFQPGTLEIKDHWWGQGNAQWGNAYRLRYALDYLQYRYFPAMLSDVQLAVGKYADAARQLTGRSRFKNGEQWLPGPAGFNVFMANPAAGGDLLVGGALIFFVDGSLPYTSFSDRTQISEPEPATSVPTNRAELGYFKLKLGNVCLEWADALYRTNENDSMMRARELYKAVIFLHGQDPEITPTWDPLNRKVLPSLPFKSSASNPAVVSQVNRARLGFMQINAGLNYYAVSPKHVPPVRFRVLKESADRFAAGARGAQSDFLSYVQQLDALTVAEMSARNMVAKANASISIAKEQQTIAEFYAGEAQKQVDAINGQIAAKKAEIAKKDEFFEQAKDFAGGMVDSVSKLGEMAFAGEGEPAPASASNLSTGDVLKLGYKVGTASNMLGAGSSALAGAAGVAGPFGAFLYAGVTSMTALADAIAKRAGELKTLQNVALPAAKALVDLKKRDVTIAQLSASIAQADWQLGRDLLAYFAQRLLNRSFLVSMVEFSNRLMRRYLDLAGRTAWIAERALAFEQDRELGIITFDYFPRNLRGVSGADVLQLHLAELEAARIQGLTQTIPIKHTVSLARDFPMAFGQLKAKGTCEFMTLEDPLRAVYPGIYGYRVRNITIGAAYAEPIQPHRGLLTNQGVSVLSRNTLNSAHTLVRYPDVLPLSEFRMREDMWVFDLPDETLLPFEGSGIETMWELSLPRTGNSNSFESITDVMITFDMRASYSAELRSAQMSALVPSANRSVLLSANASNPGALAEFRRNGGVVSLDFDLAAATFNASELARSTLNIVVMAVGMRAVPFAGTFRSPTPALTEMVSFDGGVALSNAGALADGNAGIPLPLNTFVGVDTNQTFTLDIDADANAGIDFSALSEVMLLVEYRADF